MLCEVLPCLVHNKMTYTTVDIVGVSTSPTEIVAMLKYQCKILKYS